ncbi:hypothetical protein ACTEV4_000069 [Cronobacter turicensis]|uniref:hypothetical protein n=1 Tax=Enterobacteriaceae TaxID=543 RepID=UPI000B137985|nr:MULTISPECIES: hypothetical protein [Enterobacteriaceae]EMA8648090.1 hypothetical protein [Cronobacter turicensis]EIZ9128728.1 hypothetical protein [Cronobacter sakazakii]EJG0604774.1 hypothetical protein [Cronobacter sakazakii]EJG0757677.1 hypothetical protein [Cronobacter sakazakii]EJG0818360.1 hypothetical protein [Cronobacter sakazakii]
MHLNAATDKAKHKLRDNNRANGLDGRWISLKTFCDRVGISVRTGRYWKDIGRITIRPKTKPKDHIWVDWYAWHEGK